MVPIHNVKQEFALDDFIEPTKNPFDDNADSIDSLERNPSRPKKNKYKRKRDQINSIKDPDVRCELANGNTLIEYFEQ